MEHIVKVTTAGSTGSATGTGTTASVVRGFVEAIQLDYHASAHANTDVTISEASGMTRTLLTITNNITDGVYYPRVQVCDTTGVALTLDGTRSNVTRFYLSGEALTVSVAQCNALTNAVVCRILVAEE